MEFAFLPFWMKKKMNKIFYSPFDCFLSLDRSINDQYMPLQCSHCIQ